MAQVPTGTRFEIATVYAAAKTITALSNEAECVVTSAAHGYSAGDFVEITCGWGRLNKRMFKVKASVSDPTNKFVLDGADTTSSFFPVGTGVPATVRKVTTWTQFDKVMNPQTSGGDPKNVTYKFIESDVEFSINDGFTATSYQVELDADSIGGNGYTKLKELTDVQSDTALKITMRSGSIILQPCTVALNEAVRMTDGQINRVVASFNGLARLTRYAS